MEAARIPEPAQFDDFAPEYAVDDVPPARRSFLAYFTYTKDAINTLEFWFHAALYLTIVIWGIWFLLQDFRSNRVGESFLHSIHLVFHEAGHVLFSPFGDFAAVAGGSLNQLLVPIVVAASLAIYKRDNFGGAVGLWWLGTSFRDLAPYINDARSQSLLLLGGVTGRDVPGYHDWANILGRLGLLHLDYTLAALSDYVGGGCILLAFLWGGAVLFHEYRRLDPDKYDFD